MVHVITEVGKSPVLQGGSHQTETHKSPLALVLVHLSKLAQKGGEIPVKIITSKKIDG